jgi:hypothetical protein
VRIATIDLSTQCVPVCLRICYLSVSRLISQDVFGGPDNGELLCCDLVSIQVPKYN